VLISQEEFPALRYAVLHLKHSGVDTVAVPVPPHRGLTADALEAHLAAHPEVRLVATSWVSFHNGYRCDLKSLADVTHRHDAHLIVDGIQGVGTRPLDVVACGVDVLCAAVHKWLCCPVGLAFAWCEPGLIHTHVSPWAGWMSVDWQAQYQDLLGPTRDLTRGPRAAEAGTVNFQGVRAMAEATSWHVELGVDRIERYTSELLDLLYRGLDLDRYEWLSDREASHRSAIVSLRPRRGSPEALRRFLSHRGIVTGVREGALRISPHFPTERSDIEHLVQSLHEFVPTD
jgi:selenocysteine lyase/cysteine desulfurase